MSWWGCELYTSWTNDSLTRCSAISLNTGTKPPQRPQSPLHIHLLLPLKHSHARLKPNYFPICVIHDVCFARTRSPHVPSTIPKQLPHIYTRPGDSATRERWNTLMECINESYKGYSNTFPGHERAAYSLIATLKSHKQTLVTLWTIDPRELAERHQPALPPVYSQAPSGTSSASRYKFCVWIDGTLSTYWSISGTRRGN